MLIHLPICHGFEENYKSTKLFCTNAVLAYERTCKPYSPQMFASTNYVYASATYLNISLQYGGKLTKNTAIRSEIVTIGHGVP